MRPVDIPERANSIEKTKSGRKRLAHRHRQTLAGKIENTPQLFGFSSRWSKRGESRVGARVRDRFSSVAATANRRLLLFAGRPERKDVDRQMNDGRRPTTPKRPPTLPSPFLSPNFFVRLGVPAPFFLLVFSEPRPGEVGKEKVRGRGWGLS